MGTLRLLVGFPLFLVCLLLIGCGEDLAEPESIVATEFEALLGFWPKAAQNALPQDGSGTYDQDQDQDQDQDGAPAPDTVGLMSIDSAYTVLALPNGRERRFHFGYSHSALDINVPIAGDFDGDGTETVGTYQVVGRRFLLGQRNAAGPVEWRVEYGSDRGLAWPVVGDWDGDGIDTIGVYVCEWDEFLLDCDWDEFLLRDENAPGAPDRIIAVSPDRPCLPIAGDWDGDGRDEVGLWYYSDPPAVSLLDLNGEVVGSFFLPVPGEDRGDFPNLFMWLPNGQPLHYPVVAGDWDGDQVDTLAVYDHFARRLRVLDAGGAQVDEVAIGNEAFRQWWPLAGNWNRRGNTGETAPYDWEMGDPADHGFDMQLLDAAYAEAQANPELHSLLVVRHGVLVAEQYFNGFDATMANDLMSVSKSVESALFGVAQARGELDVGMDYEIDTGDPVALYIPQYFGDPGEDPKWEILIKHLLWMAAGLYYPPGVIDPLEYVVSDDRVGWTLEQNLADDPGTFWQYNSSLAHVGMAVLEAATGRAPSDYAREHLFEPLGIAPVRWDQDRNGLDYGGIAMYLRPRDMARFGQLYVQGGIIDGEQILDPEWVSWSTSPSPLGYGAWWWTPFGPGSPRALGYGGQFIRVEPGLDLVVVTTSSWLVSPEEYYTQLTAVRSILRKVVAAADP